MGLEVAATAEAGNVCDAAVRMHGPVPELAFTIEPRRDLERIWFRFQITETDPDSVKAGAILRLLLKHVDTMPALGRASALLPVWRSGEKAWTRLLPGCEEMLADGQRGIIWELEHPKPTVEVAMCYPYCPLDLQPLLGKSRGYWQDTAIGVTAMGRRLERFFNVPGAVGRRMPGVYLIARQQAGDTPGSWVLDGFLQQISSVRKGPLMVWAVPFVDLDGVLAGDSGRNTMPWAFDCAWTIPPRRHEIQMLQSDLLRWKERCQPRLAMEFRAAASCEADGISVVLPDAVAYPDLHNAARRWAESACEMMGPGLAASQFVREASADSRLWPGGNVFSGYMASALGVPAVSVEVPYSLAGGSVLTLKRYREAGRILADTFLRRP